MLSILSGILGFATSGLPSILGFFQQKGDQKHEREMAKLQTERELELAKAGFVSQEKIEAIKLDQIEVQTYAHIYLHTIHNRQYCCETKTIKNMTVSFFNLKFYEYDVLTKRGLL